MSLVLLLCRPSVAIPRYHVTEPDGLSVWIKRGIVSCESVICILLCLLGYVPGVLYAIYIVLEYPDQVAASISERFPDEEADEAQRIEGYQTFGEDGALAAP